MPNIEPDSNESTDEDDTEKIFDEIEPGPAVYLAQMDEQEDDDDEDVFVEAMEELPAEEDDVMVREELPMTSNEEVVVEKEDSAMTMDEELTESQVQQGKDVLTKERDPSIRRTFQQRYYASKNQRNILLATNAR
ncbi:8994_t:CDS:2 [Acaulospora morrowiae]|uniref:8994_t:CDS:1 n=1 Tax=Acaulospora morrowiae TaxID=94023 RepID=A0A9N9FP61_9GLOM|nr:8994_t:CDS:2 [Acaulospora morrowiae]